VKDGLIEKLFSFDVSYAPQEFQNIWLDVSVRKRLNDVKETLRAGDKMLLHGEFIPSNWLRTDMGIYIVDFKNCHEGIPEFDLGMMTAHLLLAGIADERVANAVSTYENAKVNLDFVRLVSTLETVRFLSSPEARAVSAKQRNLKWLMSAEILKKG
jgi:thiamine kinase-like enzyme